MPEGFQTFSRIFFTLASPWRSPSAQLPHGPGIFARRIGLPRLPRQALRSSIIAVCPAAAERVSVRSDFTGDSLSLVTSCRPRYAPPQVTAIQRYFVFTGTCRIGVFRWRRIQRARQFQVLRRYAKPLAAILFDARFGVWLPFILLPPPHRRFRLGRQRRCRTALVAARTHLVLPQFRNYQSVWRTAQSVWYALLIPSLSW